jgi:hypothetical protein
LNILFLFVGHKNLFWYSVKLFSFYSSWWIKLMNVFFPPFWIAFLLTLSHMWIMTATDTWLKSIIVIVHKWRYLLTCVHVCGAYANIYTRRIYVWLENNADESFLKENSMKFESFCVCLISKSMEFWLKNIKWDLNSII